MAEPLLFLSHAGADTAPAQVLAQRLKAAGIRVWFDKDNLAPGSDGWQRQIERAVGQEATCFAVYVGARGIVNWVEAEVRVALSRAISGGAPFPFIPILSANIHSAALPPFARQFEAVRDVENDPAEWTRLLQAIVQAKRPPPEPEPFFGLRAADETRSHLFFGRRAETREIVQRIAERNLVLVAGDSGSGKSSLVLAGLVPAWRGNEVGLLRGERPSEYDWHVVVTRPRRNPRRLLAERIEDSGRPLGLSAADLTTYAGLAETGNASQVRSALRCGLDSRRTRTLLVVDQFEELIHPLVPAGMQEDFAALLAELADPGDPAVAVALTMRSDYTNLLRKPELRPLFERLEADGRRARFMLGRIQPADPQRLGDLHEPDGLSAVVTKPLRLAGRPLEEAAALARMVVNDVGTRPGDLALVQFALTKAWDARGANDDDLLRAYAAIGRVEGALAQSAEAVFQHRLGGEANEAVVSAALIRLGSLSATGTTRRLARRAEFSEAGWKVIQTLASPEGNRLVLVGGEDGAETAEIAHEALLTQWERLDAWLRADEADKRALDALAERAAASPAEESGERKPPTARQVAGLFARAEWLFGLERQQYRQPLLRSPDLERFSGLAERRPTWPSAAEYDLVQRSTGAAEAEARRDQRVRTLMRNGLAMLAAATLTVTVLLSMAGWLWTDARFQAKEADKQRDVAQQEAFRAIANETRALTALSDVASREGRYLEGVQLALAAWPRSANDQRPKLSATLDALSRVQREQRLLVPPVRHEGGARGAVFDGKGERVLSWGRDGQVRLWDATTGRDLVAPVRHADGAWGAVFDGKGERVLSWSQDGQVRLWDAKNGRDLVTPVHHEGGALGAIFDGKGERVLSWGRDGQMRLWDAATGRDLVAPVHHQGDASGAIFDGKGERVLSWGGDGQVRLWDATTGRDLVTPVRHEIGASGAIFDGKGERVLSWGLDGQVRLWDATTGHDLVTPVHHEGWAAGAIFDGKGERVLSWGRDGQMRLWDAATGRDLVAPVHHEGEAWGAIFDGKGERVLSWGRDGQVRLWDAATGHDLVAPVRHEGGAWGAVFDGKGERVLSWGRDGQVRLWDATTGGDLVAPVRHADGAWGAIFDGKGERVLSWGRDGRVRLWDAATGHDLVTPVHHADGAWGAVFDGKGERVLSWGRDGQMRLWDAATGRDLVAPVRHADGAWGAIFDGKGERVLSWGRDGQVRLWDAKTGRDLVAPVRHADGARGAVFDGKGERVLSWGGDGQVRLWDAKTGHDLVAPVRHADGARGAVFDGKGERVLSWGGDSQVRLWDAKTGRDLITPVHHEGGAWGAVFDGKGERVLSWGGDSQVRLWDAKTGHDLITPVRHADGAWGAVFDGKGERVLSWGRDGQVRLWDATTGGDLVAPVRHADGARGAVFDGKGERVLSWSQDGQVRLWDAATGRDLVTPVRHEGGARGAIFDGKGERVLSWGRDGQVRLWDAATGHDLVAPVHHAGGASGAIFDGKGKRVLSWGQDGRVRLRSIALIDGRNLLEIACNRLPVKSLTEVGRSSGIQLNEPICGSPIPPPGPMRLR